MAHKNIDDRKAAIKLLLGEREALTKKERLVIAEEFGCSVATIVVDERLCKGGVLKYYEKTNRIKEAIWKRDCNVCQYCGRTAKLVEHVVPAVYGGPLEPYNLVLACYSCNTTKGSDTWVPNNITVLENLNQKWAKRIKIEASRTRRVAAIHATVTVKTREDLKFIARFYNKPRADMLTQLITEERNKVNAELATNGFFMSYEDFDNDITADNDID